MSRWEETVVQGGQGQSVGREPRHEMATSSSQGAYLLQCKYRIEPRSLHPPKFARGTHSTTSGKAQAPAPVTRVACASHRPWRAPTHLRAVVPRRATPGTLECSSGGCDRTYGCWLLCHPTWYIGLAAGMDGTHFEGCKASRATYDLLTDLPTHLPTRPHHAALFVARDA